MDQETYARILREFEPEFQAAIEKILSVNAEVLDSRRSLEDLREPIEQWLQVRKKLNRRGIGALLNFRNPHKPLIVTFVLTGDARRDLGQNQDMNPLDDLLDKHLK